MRLIDADALLEKLWRIRWNLQMMDDTQTADKMMAGLRKAEEKIEAAPTIDPMKWTPVSERLPEDLEEVNVTWINHNPEPYYNFIKDKPFTATAVYYKEKWYWYSSTCADLLAEYGRNPNEEIDDGIEIIAWMPLPGPWEGEANE